MPDSDTRRRRRSSISERVCSVQSPGNHDDGEGIGDSRFTAWRECMDYIMSPTINLVGKGVGGATPNGMGITSSIANASDDIILWYDLYAGASNLSFTGISWVFGHQSFPGTQANGAKVWGNRQYPAFIIFNPEPQCFTDIEPFGADGFPLVSSNVGVPDSLRTEIVKAFVVLRPGCKPSTALTESIQSFVETLRYIHSSAGIESEVSRSFLLKGRSDEGRNGIAFFFFAIDRCYFKRSFS